MPMLGCCVHCRLAVALQVKSPNYDYPLRLSVGRCRLSALSLSLSLSADDLLSSLFACWLLLLLLLLSLRLAGHQMSSTLYLASLLSSTSSSPQLRFMFYSRDELSLKILRHKNSRRAASESSAFASLRLSVFVSPSALDGESELKRRAERRQS